ncbi:gliding motility-associated peptidyl-prolyl isomerase GldI [Flavobacterium sp.]|uniref:gliding motility-associated peptidyl-prolyl isomerase GldI n=1 Tax=Flavobacterium sp. TaxID=239 RepID=UPI00286DD759|nr:gliding motility-associated peptidyl-prolyl isomerase GldI [Flavobacterium sp.]
MKLLKIFCCLFLGVNLVTCCTPKQEPRRPISQKSGAFMKQSIERNIKMNQNEEALIESIIEKDTSVDYISSKKGYWYHYIIKNDSVNTKPIKGDVAFFDYEIKDLKGNIIYSQLELKPQKYIVDKQNIMIGLRDGIKLMKKGEKVTFLFPSHMGYGYHGDSKKVTNNIPLMCTVTLNDIKQENELKIE